MILGKTEEKQVEVVSEDFTAVAVEAESQLQDVNSTVVALEQGERALVVTGAILANESEVSDIDVISSVALATNTAQSFGVENLSPITVAVESETSKRGQVIVAHEGLKEMLAKGWKIFKDAIVASIASAEKLYYAVAGKIRGFEKRGEKVIEKLKKIKATSEAVELEGKIGKQLRNHLLQLFLLVEIRNLNLILQLLLLQMLLKLKILLKMFSIQL